MNQYAKVAGHEAAAWCCIGLLKLHCCLCRMQLIISLSVIIIQSTNYYALKIRNLKKGHFRGSCWFKKNNEQVRTLPLEWCNVMQNFMCSVSAIRLNI